MLNRETLTRQVFDALIQKIIDDGLKPGETLPSTVELTELFDVSRPVVREALSALHACNFIELRNGRPPVVAQLDGQLLQMFIARASRFESDAMAKLMEVRIPLEAQAAQLAAERATPGDVQRLAEINRQMSGALSESALYPGLDVAFHAQIAASVQNPVLMWTIHSIRSELMTMMVVVRKYREQHGLVGHEQAQHEEIFEAISDRDAAAAAEAMTRHLQSTFTLVRDIELGAAPRPVDNEAHLGRVVFPESAAPAAR